jgi:chemotaxis protein MotB
MARKRKHQAHENHERWLVSYADFITLLFAFFVVMFASAQADKTRAKHVADSVRKAFEHSKVAAVLGGTVEDQGQGNAQMKGAGGGRKETERAIAEAKAAGASHELVQAAEMLAKELSSEIEKNTVHLKMEKRGLVVSFAQTLLFDSGGAEAFESSYSALDKVAQAIRRLPNPVRLEGHTDSVPIHNSRYHSNWELSAARSIAVLELLAVRGGVERERMSIGGYADVAPLESNETPEGRARNRRVDIVVLSPSGQEEEPRTTRDSKTH